MNLSPSQLMVLLRRWPYCAVCVGLMIASGAGAWFMRQEISLLQQARADRSKEGEAMLGLLVSASTQRQELEAVREATRRIEENLVVEGNMAENYWYFFKLEEQTKVRLPELNQLSSPTTDKSPLYKRIPYSLRIAGTYEQVAGFVQALESGPRLVRIINFNFARTDANGSTIAVDLNLEMLGKK